MTDSKFIKYARMSIVTMLLMEPGTQHITYVLIAHQVLPAIKGTGMVTPMILAYKVSSQQESVGAASNTTCAVAESTNRKWPAGCHVEDYFEGSSFRFG